MGLMNRRGDQSVYHQQCIGGAHLYTNPFAKFVSFGLGFFLLVSSCWWMIQALDLFQRLILGLSWRRGTLEYKRRRLAIHLFCWIMPLICMIGLAVADQLQYDGSLPVPISGVSPRSTDPGGTLVLMWAFFFIPVILLAVIGLILISIILYFLIQHDPTDGLKKFNQQLEKSSTIWFKFQQILKLFGFVFLMIPLILFTAIHVVYVANDAPLWKESLTTWGEIYVLTGVVDFVKVEHRMAPGRILLTMFGFCSPGIVMGLLYFVFSTDILQLWCGLFYWTCGCTCGFVQKWAKEDTVTGSNSGSSGSHGSSGSNGSTDIFSMDKLTKDKRIGDSVSDTSGVSGLTLNVSSALGTSGVGHTNSGTTFDDYSANTHTAVFSSSQPNSPGNSATTSKAAMEKRKTLFKGFKNTSMVPEKKNKPQRTVSRPDDDGPPPSNRDETGAVIELVALGEEQGEIAE
jgi:hypothetical protein